MTQISEKDVILAYALAKFDAIVAIVGYMDDATADATLPVADSNSPQCAADALPRCDASVV